MTSETKKTCKTADDQLRDQTCNVQDSLTVINFLTEVERASDFPGVLGAAANWLFEEIIYGPAFAAINGQLTHLFSDANRNESSITSYDVAVSHPWR